MYDVTMTFRGWGWLDLQVCRAVSMPTRFLAFFLLCAYTVSYGQLDEVSDSRYYYSNWWAVEIQGSSKEATDLAEENGFVNLGKVIG